MNEQSHLLIAGRWGPTIEDLCVGTPKYVPLMTFRAARVANFYWLKPVKTGKTFLPVYQ